MELALAIITIIISLLLRLPILEVEVSVEHGVMCRFHISTSTSTSSSSNISSKNRSHSNSCISQLITITTTHILSSSTTMGNRATNLSIYSSRKCNNDLESLYTSLYRITLLLLPIVPLPSTNLTPNLTTVFHRHRRHCPHIHHCMLLQLSSRALIILLNHLYLLLRRRLNSLNLAHKAVSKMSFLHIQLFRPFLGLQCDSSNGELGGRAATHLKQAER
jgi:hypothetical protein